MPGVVPRGCVAQATPHLFAEIIVSLAQLAFRLHDETVLYLVEPLAEIVGKSAVPVAELALYEDKENELRALAVTEVLTQDVALVAFNGVDTVQRQRVPKTISSV